MPIIQFVKVAFAALIALVGVYGLYLMFTAEVATETVFTNYFPWALGAGIVFVAVGLALAIFDHDDTVDTRFDDSNG